MITKTQGYSVSDPAVPGSTVTLSCTIDANPLELNQIRWFKNDEELVLNSNIAPWERRFEGNEASLITRGVRRDDAGHYACEIENALGKSRATLPLVVQCKLTSAGN